MDYKTVSIVRLFPWLISTSIIHGTSRSLCVYSECYQAIQTAFYHQDILTARIIIIIKDKLSNHDHRTIANTIKLQQLLLLVVDQYYKFWTCRSKRSIGCVGRNIQHCKLHIRRWYLRAATSSIPPRSGRCIISWDFHCTLAAIIRPISSSIGTNLWNEARGCCPWASHSHAPSRGLCNAEEELGSNSLIRLPLPQR